MRDGPEGGAQPEFAYGAQPARCRHCQCHVCQRERRIRSARMGDRAQVAGGLRDVYACRRGIVWDKPAAPWEHLPTGELRRGGAFAGLHPRWLHGHGSAGTDVRLQAVWTVQRPGRDGVLSLVLGRTAELVGTAQHRLGRQGGACPLPKQPSVTSGGERLRSRRDRVPAR